MRSEIETITLSAIDDLITEVVISENRANRVIQKKYKLEDPEYKTKVQQSMDYFDSLRKKLTQRKNEILGYVSMN